VILSLPRCGIGLYTNQRAWYYSPHDFIPTGLEPRLQRAYLCLVKGFGKTGSSTAPGPAATVDGMRAESFAQKLSRFCMNPRVEESALIEPMHEAIRHAVSEGVSVFLAIHDWSISRYRNHKSKTDRATLTHAHHVGYDLATVLLVRADDGAPVAPASVALTNADGVLSTREPAPTVDIPHLDQVLPTMQDVRDTDFGATVVHVIDREADSVNHWRQWSADGHLALTASWHWSVPRTVRSSTTGNRLRCSRSPRN
jgi:hypothetical protein